MPAQLGWHPWFRRPVSLTFAARSMYLRDDRGHSDRRDHLATGRAVGRLLHRLGRRSETVVAGRPIDEDHIDLRSLGDLRRARPCDLCRTAIRSPRWIQSRADARLDRRRPERPRHRHHDLDLGLELELTDLRMVTAGTPERRAVFSCQGAAAWVLRGLAV